MIERIGDSSGLPGRFRSTYTVADHIQLELVITVTGGVPRCTEVRMFATRDDVEVEARHLRDRKWENLIERACAVAALSVTAEDTAVVVYEPVDTESEARQALAEIRRARRAGRRPARGRGYPDELLRRVAETYEHGGRHPTRAVQEAEGVAQSTAQLYVKKARERGFITRPAPGRREPPPPPEIKPAGEEPK